MELTHECPACGGTTTLPQVEDRQIAVCRCGAARALRPQLIEGGELSGCPVCATGDLYRQKDFPHGLGLLIVGGGFAASTIFWYRYQPALALAALLATAALDVVLYYLVPDVTICYRCLSQYRGEGSHPAGRFGPFDLAIGERYRQERLRVDELRARVGPEGPPPGT